MQYFRLFSSNFLHDKKITARQKDTIYFELLMCGYFLVYHIKVALSKLIFTRYSVQPGFWGLKYPSQLLKKALVIGIHMLWWILCLFSSGWQFLILLQSLRFISTFSIRIDAWNMWITVTCHLLCWASIPSF